MTKNRGHDTDIGLKKLRRNQTDKEPTYKCDNCKCMRYSPCGCQKKRNTTD